MPNVAMYHALKDSDVTLQQDPNSKAGFDFNPPDDIQLPDSGLSMPAIQFGVFSQLMTDIPKQRVPPPHACAD